jgi:hypothetical protein
VTLRLLPPLDGGQDRSRPPRRRSPNSLAPDERRNLRQALKNLRLRFGSWSCLAEVMDVSVDTLKEAAGQGAGHGSPGIALRAARAAGSTIEAVLSGKLSPLGGACPSCGASSAARRSA